MHEFSARLRFRRDHRWAPDRMSDYLDGEMAPRGRARMKRHLGECAECRRLIAGLTLVIDALHRMPAPELGSDPVVFVGSVRRRMAEPPAP